MNKVDFVNHIAELHNCTKTEAEKVIDMFTTSVIDVIRKGHEISLIGFGNFTINEVEARAGINPKTKEQIQIAARKQVRFKVGQKLKDACNAK